MSNHESTTQGTNMTTEDRVKQCIASHAKNFERMGGNRTMAMVACMQHCEAIVRRDLRSDETHDLFAAF